MGPRLELLSPECHDALAGLKATLSTDQIAEGARRAKAWQAQHPNLTK